MHKCEDGDSDRRKKIITNDSNSAHYATSIPNRLHVALRAPSVQTLIPLRTRYSRRHGRNNGGDEVVRINSRSIIAQVSSIKSGPPTFLGDH